MAEDKANDQPSQSELATAGKAINTHIPMVLKPLALARKSLTYYLKGIYHRADTDHIFLFGSGLAFSLFICIVPLVLIIFSILGNILESTNLERQIMMLIDRMIPYPNYADFAKAVISSRIHEVVEHRELAGVIGACALLFGASTMFSSLRTILNTVFRVAAEPIVRGKLKDFILISCVIVLISLSTTILPLMELMTTLADRFVWLSTFRFSWLEAALFRMLSILIVFGMLAILYYIIPFDQLPFKTAVVSAVWATILWQVAQKIFGYYITHVATLNKIYGGYIFVVIVAFWIYYSAIVFILGAEIGQLHREKTTIQIYQKV